MEIKCNLILFQEGDIWIAHGLEYDIAAQGKTKILAKESFIKILKGQIYLDIFNNKKPLEDFGKAPQEIWNKSLN